MFYLILFMKNSIIFHPNLEQSYVKMCCKKNRSYFFRNCFLEITNE